MKRRLFFLSPAAVLPVLAFTARAAPTATVTVHNATGAQVSVQAGASGDIELIIERAAERANALVATDVSRGSGPVPRALASRGIVTGGGLPRRS